MRYNVKEIMPQLPNITSYLIVSKELVRANAYVQTCCVEKNILAIDRTTIEVSKDEKGTAKSIGIDEIKRLQKTLFLHAHGTDKAIIIVQSDCLTTEAQNALLKLLEEPPKHSYFFLVATSVEHILPTILSRCSLVILDEKTEVSSEKIYSLQQQLLSLSGYTLAQCLELAEQVSKKKEDAISWLTTAILVSRYLILNRTMQREVSDIESLVSSIRAFQTALQTIKTTNANPRLILESVFLGLSQNA